MDPPQRIRPAKEHTAHRNSYSLEEKANVIFLFDQCQKIATVTRETGISRNCIERWLKQRDEIAKALSDKENTVAASRKHLGFKAQKLYNPDVEKYIYQWILEQKAANKPVNRKLIQQRALEFMQENSLDNIGLKAGRRWVKSMLQRHHMVIGKDSRLHSSFPSDLEKDSSHLMQEHDSSSDSLKEQSFPAKPLKECVPGELGSWFESTFPGFRKAGKFRTRRSMVSSRASNVVDQESRDSFM